jgi:hypothetical protein
MLRPVDLETLEAVRRSSQKAGIRAETGQDTPIGAAPSSPSVTTTGQAKRGRSDSF